MPKLEVRLTQAEFDRLEADRGELDRSAYVRLRVFGVDPDARRNRVQQEIGARRRAQGERTAAMRERAANTQPPEPRREEPAPPASPPVEPGVDLSAPMVALQGGVPYHTAQEWIDTGRARLEEGRLLIDGKPL